jgi:D-alanyl-D-alanine carboxypeptidase
MTRTVVKSGNSGYGLGVGKTLTGCGDGWGHDGSVPGYGSLAVSTRDGSRQVVILINTSPRETTPTSPVFGRVSEALASGFCP